jgi:hypothetical protein
MPGTGLDEILAVIRELGRRQTDRRGVAVAPRYAVADKCIFRSDDAVIHTLSPSDGSVQRALMGLASLVPLPGAPISRLSVGRNWTSVVLLVEALGFVALLGADLEIAGGGEGWTAVVGSTSRPSARADVYKVAHHGSKDADDERIWTTLVRDSPIAVLTPFRKGRVPLPRPSDVERLCARTRGTLFSTASTSGPALPKRDPAVERTIREVALERRTITGPSGIVRIRSIDGKLVTETFNGARALC